MTDPDRSIPRPRGPGRVRLARALLLTAVAAGLVGCGSGDDEGDQASAAETWASDVCSTALDWRTTIEDVKNTLSDTGSLSADVIRDAVDDVENATASLVADLGEVGVPDTEAGDEAAAEVTTLSEKLQEQELSLIHI